MPIYQVKVTPRANHVFGTEHLMVAMHRKKLKLPFPTSNDTFLRALVDTLENMATDVFKVNIDDKTVDVRSFKNKIKLATWAWKVTPADLLSGNHQLQVHVVEPRDVDDDGKTMVVLPLEVEEPKESTEWPKYTDLVNQGKVTVASGIRSMMGAEEQDKAVSIFMSGNTYTGHGPTTSLGLRVFHTHVTNRTALGFRWRGEVLELVGWGEKNDSAPSGTSKYDWTT